MGSTPIAASVSLVTMVKHVKTTSMNVNQIPVGMVEHAQMTSTDIPAPASMDT